MRQTTPSTTLRASIDRLIIDSPFEEPSHYWRYVSHPGSR